MRKRLTIIFAALSLTACIVIVHATPAQDRLWATRVKCELQTAGEASLPGLVWQQGSTPLLSLDQFRSGKSFDADSNVVAIVRFGPSATNAYFVTATNYAVSANGYLVQLPTIGTNTTAVGTGADWWYTAYFERAGYRYWTGNGRVKIVATTSTSDGLNWQSITDGGLSAVLASGAVWRAEWEAGDAVARTNLQVAITAEALARAAGDLVAMTNWQASVNALTNGAALGTTALQPSWAETGTVAHAETVTGVQSNLIAGALQTEVDPIWTAVSDIVTSGAASGATALQPSWAETGTVFRATEVIGAQSTLIETAWQNPATAADWTWTSNGREITLTGYSGPNAVVIPDMLDGLPVTGFGEVFKGNVDITSVGGGANIKAVGDYAFRDCWALNSVSLPACTTVGAGAFLWCRALNSVSLPACTTVGNNAFYDCEALISVTFGQNAPAPATEVFEYSTPTIYVSNPHATGWGDTWNGRPVVRAASMSDIASHNTNGTAHADIRAAIADAPTWGVTNQLLYLDAGSVTGMVFRMGATNIYLWQVQP